MTTPSTNVLVMNAGSSSQKTSLFRIEGGGDAAIPPFDPPTPVWEAEIEWSAPSGATLTVKTNGPSGKNETHETLPPGTSRRDGTSRLLQTLWQGEGAVVGSPDEIHVVGHRIVHGGSDFREPTRITPAVKQAIERLIPLAPEHNPAALDGINAVEERLGGEVFAVAVFDTAFHRTLPDAAAIYPGPYSWAEKEGIRRYGFHGINHAWCSERAARLLPNSDPSTLRLVCCHLGNGCSLAAVRGGKCVDTTMGFTPMEGLMMGSRSGSVDPGVLLYLMTPPNGPSAADLNRILNKESGLKGLSGVGEDLRAVIAAIEAGDARARLALDVYVHRLRSFIGAMIAGLGGLDVLVFTAGVGENSAAVRARACEPFAFLGLLLDEEKNNAPTEAGPGAEREISRPDSRVRVLVIPAHEDWAVARESVRLAGTG